MSSGRSKNTREDFLVVGRPLVSWGFSVDIIIFLEVPLVGLLPAWVSWSNSASKAT
jgi:hypothetical protein